MRQHLVITLCLLFLTSLSLSAQKVGINTDNPEFDLDIRGLDDTNDGGELQLAIPSQGSFLRFFSGRLGDHHPFMAFSDDDTLHLVTTLPDWSTYTRRMTFMPSGNVGVGIQYPQALLHVMGGQWNLPGGSYGDFKIGNDVIGLSAGVALDGGGAGISRIYAKGGLAKLIFGSDNTDVISIDSANHVGIGTTSPQTRLDVAGGQWDVGTTEGDMRLGSSSYRLVAGVSTSGGGAGISRIYAKGGVAKLILGSDDKDVITIDSANRVGIGTVPHEFLEVAGTGTLAGRVFIGDGGGNNRKGLLIDAVEAGNYVRLNPYDYGSASNMDLYVPGKVGIGTSTPTTALQVLGAENNGVTATLTVSNSTHSLLLDGNEIDAISTHLDLQNNSSNNLILVTGGGNVGVGTVAPNARLAVNGTMTIGNTLPATGYMLSVYGKVIAEELRVQLHSAWPDYVFDKDYALPDLQSVKNYVDLNKHLPGIPNAQDVAANGILVGEMQGQLLQKIEELTLYIIDMDKEITRLKQEVNDLKNK